MTEQVTMRVRPGAPAALRCAAPRALAAAVAGVLIMAGSLGMAPAAAVGALHAPIVGSGSTWSANALQAWIANVWRNYQWKISYSESGSTQGRNDFANATADFGVSEIPYQIANSNEGDPRPRRGFVYMPIVAGGTAFMYNLVIGGKRVTNLRLSGENLAKIFTGVITTWNDPAIALDNPALAMPALPIVPVVRSDGSGATAQVSIWMRQQHTAIWDAYCGAVSRGMVNGHCGVTSNYPVVPGSGFVSRSGSNGVAGYVAQSHAVGAITFVEYSYAINAGFPVVKLLNAAGYYTEPKASNVAVALLSARINEDTTSQDYLTQDLSQVYTSTDPRVYPLSSYSYIILPTAVESGFSEDKGLTLADFGAYFLCEGQQSAEELGYSPLPINLVQAGQAQIQKIPGGDPVIKGIAACNNPTFSPDGTNRLATEAPFPADCDRQGITECAEGTGGAADTPTDVSKTPEEDAQPDETKSDDTNTTNSQSPGGTQKAGSGANADSSAKQSGGAAGTSGSAQQDASNQSGGGTVGSEEGTLSGNGSAEAGTEAGGDAAQQALAADGSVTMVDGVEGEANGNAGGGSRASVVAGEPQTLPRGNVPATARVAMAAAGVILLTLAAVPPYLARRRRRGR
ncbi:MAG: substrate-binding domain-containing protein [Bifidobacteriaceae bacterium]|jgi:phosphate ABC transporter phosphate-binding protein|nr:substrate-binding domain-containing protein [Bifidobacteriaceae bacterium]